MICNGQYIIYATNIIIYVTSLICSVPIVDSSKIPYTRKFLRYVNFTDFADAKAEVKIKSVKISG